MARVKRGVTSHAKHKKVLEQAKGFSGRRKNTIRTAKAAVDRAGQYAYRDRRAKKRFKFTATGKVKAGVAGKRHRLISHNSKYIRQNRGTKVMADADAKKIKSYMPYA